MAGSQHLTLAVISLQVSVSQMTSGEWYSGLFSLQGLACFTWLEAWTGKHWFISLNQGYDTPHPVSHDCPAVHSDHLPKFAALMADTRKEEAVLELITCTGSYLCSINFFVCFWGLFGLAFVNYTALHTGAAQGQGCLFCSLCCGECQHGGGPLSPLDEADNISNCCGEDLWSAVKVWGPFHNLPLPLSSDLYISTVVCSIYTHYKDCVADTV